MVTSDVEGVNVTPVSESPLIKPLTVTCPVPVAMELPHWIDCALAVIVRALAVTVNVPAVYVTE